MKGYFAVCLTAFLFTGFAAADVEYDFEDSHNSTVGNYTLTDSKGNICFELAGTISFLVKHPSSTNALIGTFRDEGKVTNGTCGAVKTTVSIDNPVGMPGVAHPAKLEMEFTLNATTKTWVGGSFLLTLYGESEDSDYVSGGNGDTLGASATEGLQCSQSNVSINGTAGKGVVMLNNYLLYPGLGVAVNGNAATCPYDKKPSTSNVVPIAVGCALAGLVLIVLVAYLIGRTRHERQHKGYQSV